MQKSFTTFANRLDCQLTGFSSDDNASLLAAICTNPATSCVSQKTPSGPVSVPAYQSAAVCEHLVKMGWMAR